ncbi:MAG: hypothetical protein ACRYGG_21045 [Janthinobacterium lividum]
MSEQTSAIESIGSVRLSAAASATSNGQGAKTAKVSIVARTANPVVYGDLGRIVHDFDGMTTPSRIPLDVEHGHESIGYLNRFDTSSGDLVATGAIVMADDDSSVMVQRMIGGVPYQASIDHGMDDAVVEHLPAGQSATINSNSTPSTVSGPATIFRQFVLRAVALCKYGADSGTSASIQMTQRKPDDGFVIRFSKRGLHMSMTEAKAVEMTAEVLPVKPVETKVETPKVEPKVETKVEPIKTVEPVVEAPVKPHEVKAETPKVDPKVEQPVKATPPEEKTRPTEVVEAVHDVVEVKKPIEVKLSDAVNVFQSYLSAFGGERAALYFSKGMTLTDATLEYSKELRTENDDLKTRLASLDRGAPRAVKMSKAEPEAKKPMAGVIRIK